MESERRRFVRLTLDPPFKVKFRLIYSKVSLKSADERGALIRNISIGGGLIIELALKSKEEEDDFLNGKAKLCFEAGIPGAPPKIKILGKVAWSKKMDKPGLLYEAGVAFENIDAKTQENILYAMIDLAFKQKNLKV